VSAPRRPLARETALELEARARADAAGRLFAEQVILNASAAADRESKRAYMRPGDPRGLCFTAQQWRDFDEWNALWDKQQARYGRLMARAGLTPRNLTHMRGMW
jgi:hypothetical protein